MQPEIETLLALSQDSLSQDSLVSAQTSALPAEAIPPVILRYCQELAVSLPAPVELTVIPALVAAGAAIGGKRAIQLKVGWIETPALYAAVVQPPGTMKSPALHQTTRPLQAQQCLLAQKHTDALRRFEEIEWPAYERAVGRYKRGQDDIPPEKPIKPIMGRTWVADTTAERLAGLLKENPDGLLIIRDELSGWVRGMNQYKNGRGADRQFFLSAWSQAPVSVDRQGKDPLIVERPFLSVIGCIPPAVLPELAEGQGEEDGFLHRILFAYPEPVPIRWTDHGVSEEASQQYDQLFEKLFQMPRGGDGRPIILTLTTHARHLFSTWHDEHCAEMELDCPAESRGFWAKLKGICGRLALIHAVCTDPSATTVTEASISAACDLTDYFRRQVEKVAPLFAKRKPSPHRRCEDEIRRALAGGRRLSKRAIQRSGHSPATVFNEVFGAMIQAEQLDEFPLPGGRGERKVYQLAGEDT